MRKYRFCVDGETVSVYPCSDANATREYATRDIGEGEILVLIYPGGDTDFCASSFSNNNSKSREPQLALAALSCFFRGVRGYPKMTVDVMLDGVTYELSLDRLKTEFLINVGKCKILCTKTIKFEDGIEISVGIVQGEGRAAVTVCADSDMVDEGRMRLLLSRLSEYGVDAVLAVSVGDEVRAKCIGEISPIDAIRIIDVVLMAEGMISNGGSYTILLNERRRLLTCREGKILYYPEIKYLY